MCQIIGDQMDWFSQIDMYSILILGVIISTSLMIGFSLVEVNLQQITKKIIFLGCIASLLYYLSTFLLDDIHILIILYLGFIPIVIYYFKVPFLQSVLSILLALTFNLTIIHLLAYNLFDMALKISNVPNDPVMIIAFNTFLMFTNIFIALIIYYKTPVLFPNRWFNIKIVEGSQANLLKLHVFFITLILVAINLFLYFTFVELPNLRIPFRIFVMLWGIIICCIFLFFSKRIVIYNMERMQFSLDKVYQKDLQSFYHIIRSQRHDFNIHLNTIYGLIQSEKFTETNEYINKVVKEARDINELLPLHHPEIGAMLYTYKELALQKGINIQFQIKDDLRTMPCNIYEMNKILGNLLQNAIEAVDSGTVEVTIAKRFDQITVSVANQINLDHLKLEDMFSHGFSTKSTHEGIGLPTIQNIISKFNGVMYPEIIDDRLIMNVHIPLIQ